MADKRRLNLSFSLASPQQREAWRILSSIPAGQRTDAILFDDITIYLSNLLYGKEALQGTTTEKAAAAARRIGTLLEAARATERTVVFVSNDVGAGIVPDNAMAREYRDIAGWVNQQIGAAADKVFYVIAGQAVDIKRLAFRFDETAKP